MSNLLHIDINDTFTNVAYPIEKLGHPKVWENTFLKTSHVQERYLMLIHYETFQSRWEKLKKYLNQQNCFALILMKILTIKTIMLYIFLKINDLQIQMRSYSLKSVYIKTVQLKFGNWFQQSSSYYEVKVCGGGGRGEFTNLSHLTIKLRRWGGF